MNNIRIITSSGMFAVYQSYADGIFRVKCEDTGKLYNIGVKEIESIVLPVGIKNMLLLLGANVEIKAYSTRQAEHLLFLSSIGAAEYIPQSDTYRLTQQGYALYLTQKVLWK